MKPDSTQREFVNKTGGVACSTLILDRIRRFRTTMINFETPEFSGQQQAFTPTEGA